MKDVKNKNWQDQKPSPAAFWMEPPLFVFLFFSSNGDRVTLRWSPTRGYWHWRKKKKSLEEHPRIDSDGLPVRIEPDGLETFSEGGSTVIKFLKTKVHWKDNYRPRKLNIRHTLSDLIGECVDDDDDKDDLKSMEHENRQQIPVNQWITMLYW